MVLFLAIVGSAAVVDAQSLGEVARREQEKKKDAPAASAPSYTETDLKGKRSKSKGTVSEMPATGARDVGVKGAPPDPKAIDPKASPAPGASPEPDASPEPERDRDRQEREWRVRFADARTRLAEAEEKAYEERVQVVFVSGVPVQQMVRTKVETPALIAARQALLDLEEDLRRSGGLPGWGRQ